MKKNICVLTIAVTAIFFAACGNNKAGTGTGSGDSSANVVRPSTNNDATNPSVADTAFSTNNADTAKMKRDSSKMKH